MSVPESNYRAWLAKDARQMIAAARRVQAEILSRLNWMII